MMSVFVYRKGKKLFLVGVLAVFGEGLGGKNILSDDGS